MGRLQNDVMQKFMPAARKMIRIRFRRKNGRWLEFDLSPGKDTFHFKGSDAVYRIEGLPDFEDETSQRLYTYFEGVPYAIKSHTQHPELLVMGREAGNQQIQLINAEERGFQRALLLKTKKDVNFLMYVLIITGINLLVSLAIAYTVFMT